MHIFHSIPESRLTQEDVVTDGLEIVVDDAVAGAFSLDEIAPALAVEVITVRVCLAVPCHTRTCKPGRRWECGHLVGHPTVGLDFIDNNSERFILLFVRW